MLESEIVTLLCNRDERALEAVRNQYGRSAETLACRILGNPLDAEECVSDALLRLWETVPPVLPDCLPAYFTTLVRRRALDLLSAANAGKRGGGQYPLALDELSPYLAAPDCTEDILTQTALKDAVARFLKSLTTDARRIFLARYYAFQPIAGIAEKMGCTEGKIKMSLKRTKEKLREALRKEGLL